MSVSKITTLFEVHSRQSYLRSSDSVLTKRFLLDYVKDFEQARFLA